jgi:hypothetical protein
MGVATNIVLNYFYMKRFFVYMVVVLAAACSKGNTGPAGVQGPAGPQGVKGDSGNANVVVDTFSLTSAQFAYNSFYNFETTGGSVDEWFTRYHDCAFPAVTGEVLATGMVLAYFVPDPLDFPNQWAPLPYSFLAFGDQYYYNFAFQTDTGVVRIQYYYTPNGTSGTIPNTLSTEVIPTRRYKLIAVSGEVADAMRREQVDVGDEAAVTAFAGTGK